jgi:hypothetical protein
MNLLVLLSEREKDTNYWLGVIQDYKGLLNSEPLDLSILVLSKNRQVSLGYALWRWLLAHALLEELRGKVDWLLGAEQSDFAALPRKRVFGWLGDRDYQREQRIVAAVILREIDYARCIAIEWLEDDPFHIVDHMIDVHELELVVDLLANEDFRTDVSDLRFLPVEGTGRVFSDEYSTYDLRRVVKDHESLLRRTIDQNPLILDVIEPIYRSFIENWLLHPWIEVRADSRRRDSMWMSEYYLRSSKRMNIDNIIETLHLNPGLRPEVSNILRRISLSLEGIDGYESLIDNLKHVEGGQPGLLGNHHPINLIPSDRKSACNPIVVAFARGKTGKQSFKEIIKQFTAHLAACDGKTQVALFFTDRFAPEEYANYDTIIATYKRKGVTILPFLVVDKEIYSFAFSEVV